jgi:Outer membrane protein beta-barrel domain
MRRSVVVLLFCLCAAATLGRAQAVEAADARQFTITAGGMASGFQPDEGGNYLLGAGTYADFHLTHWVQLEAEARWLRWNEYFGEHQDNYLIGPRIPIKQLGSRTELYGKALVGYGRMTFPFGYGYGSFTEFAFGAAVDHQLSRKLSVKADFEYQYWPVWLNNTSLAPYGASIGVGYRVF